MGIFDRFSKREIVDENAIDNALLQALIGNEEINREKALEIPVVSSCVDLICNTFAMIPFKLYKEETKDFHYPRHLHKVSECIEDKNDKL